METQALIDQQKAMLELDRQAYEEARMRYQAEIHELRRAFEADCQATDRALAARVLDLNQREAAVTEREAAAAVRDTLLADIQIRLTALHERLQ